MFANAQNHTAQSIIDTLILSADISPDNATNKNVIWTSSDESVATVSNGKVTALRGGTADITVITNSLSRSTANRDTLTVYVKSNDITLDSLVVNDIVIAPDANDAFGYTVTAENTDIKQVYRLKVKRFSLYSTLSGLTVNGMPVPEFSPSTINYLFSVKNKVSAVTIGATPAYAGADVSGQVKDCPLSVGDTVFIIITLTADGKTKTLSAAGTDTVPSSVSSIAINAVANHSKASVSGDVGTKTLNVGDNVFSVTVAAEDETITREYTVTVRRLSGDVLLRNVTVNGTTAVPNDTVTFDHTVSSVIIKATATHELAEVKGGGIYSLNFRENVFPVVVTAEDTAQSTDYTITVTHALPAGQRQINRSGQRQDVGLQTFRRSLA